MIRTPTKQPCLLPLDCFLRRPSVDALTESRVEGPKDHISYGQYFWQSQRTWIQQDCRSTRYHPHVESYVHPEYMALLSTIKILTADHIRILQESPLSWAFSPEAGRILLFMRSLGPLASGGELAVRSAAPAKPSSNHHLQHRANLGRLPLPRLQIPTLHMNGWETRE